MEMSPLIRRAWDLSLKHKSLWIFGLFAEGIGSIKGIVDKSSPDGNEGLFSSLSPNAIVLLVTLAVFVGLAFLIMAIISNAALVDGANKITRGGQYRWSSSFSAGVDFFWRFLGLGLLMVGAFIALLLVLALPVISGFLVNTVLGVILIVILLPFLVLGAFVILSVYNLAQRAIVVRNIAIADAIEEAYLLLKLYRSECIKIFLVVFLLAICTGIVVIGILGLIAAPFVLMALTSGTGIIMAIAIGLPIVLLVMLILDGLFGTFYSSLYTLFYFALLEPAPAVHPGLASQPML